MPLFLAFLPNWSCLYVGSGGSKSGRPGHVHMRLLVPQAWANTQIRLRAASKSVMRCETGATGLKNRVQQTCLQTRSSGSARLRGISLMLA